MLTRKFPETIHKDAKGKPCTAGGFCNYVKPIASNFFEEDDCYKCLTYFGRDPVSYCSSGDVWNEYKMQKQGYCCGAYTNETMWMRPKQCYSIPELNYLCSNEFEGSPLYTQYLRYATCLDVTQVVELKDCGIRELYDQVGPSTAH